MSWEKVLKNEEDMTDDEYRRLYGDGSETDFQQFRNKKNELQRELDQRWEDVDIGLIRQLVEAEQRNSDDMNAMMFEDMADDIRKLERYTEEIILELKEYFENPLSEENPSGHKYRKEFRD